MARQLGRWRTSDPSPIGARPGASLASSLLQRARVGAAGGERGEGIELTGRDRQGNNWNATVYSPHGRDPDEEGVRMGDRRFQDLAQRPDEPDAMRVRRSVVEHIFGTIKDWDGAKPLPNTKAGQRPNRNEPSSQSAGAVPPTAPDWPVRRRLRLPERQARDRIGRRPACRTIRRGRCSYCNAFPPRLSCDSFLERRRDGKPFGRFA